MRPLAKIIEGMEKLLEVKGVREALIQILEDLAEEVQKGEGKSAET